MNIPFLDLGSMHAEVSGELDAAWRQVTRSGQFIGGEFVERFEGEWATYCGAKYCVGVASGTAALELSLAALGISSGDEVIIPANTFVATAEAVVAVGATPVFIDVDPLTLLMTAAHIEAALTPRTAAVIAVHLYGQPVDMDAVRQVGSRAGIAVLEDAAQAHGATWNGQKAGGLSDAGCFSFYPSKNLGAFGDAGAVVTGDLALAERIRSMSNHGRARNAPNRHEIKGGNHRLDGMQASILSLKLMRLDAWNDARRRVAKHYEVVLADLPVEWVKTSGGACSNHHLVVIRSPHRDELQQRLAIEGISTGIHYPTPCHHQPAFSRERSLCLPVVEQAADQVLSLPMFPHLSEAAIRRVGDTIKDALAQIEPSWRLIS